MDTAPGAGEPGTASGVELGDVHAVTVAALTSTAASQHVRLRIWIVKHRDRRTHMPQLGSRTQDPQRFPASPRWKGNAWKGGWVDNGFDAFAEAETPRLLGLAYALTGSPHDA